METKIDRGRVEIVKSHIGFEGGLIIDRVDIGGGSVMFWRKNDTVTVLSYSRNYIDIIVKLDGEEPWRLTGFYGFLEASRRRDSWNLIRRIKDMSMLPWVCLGNFNDLLSPIEKRGRREIYLSNCEGFRQARDYGELIGIESRGYSFAWERGRDTDNWVEEKLDRAVACPNRRRKHRLAIVEHLATATSDHIPILLHPSSLVYVVKVKPFRSENLWIRETECKEIVEKAWNSLLSNQNLEKINICGHALQTWGDSLSKQFHEKIKESKRQMSALRGRCDVEGRRRFMEAQLLYSNTLARQEIFWRQRAKQHWLRDGDRNSKFFHVKASARKKKNTISQLKDDNGVWRSWKDGRVAPSDNALLIEEVTEVEIKQTVFSMHPDKAPGPDGMNPSFFQTFWHIIGRDVVESCVQILNSESLPRDLNDTFVTLIPKKGRLETIGDFRPITLYNVLYKIISKVLANRLKRIFDKVVSKSQSAFIPGRLITDNVLLAF
ncbi:uncharacterized protein LOC125220464 [Salvia hispanica]|uniref:uncharacterized protein LOC125220464 n=1 Tax=Salvia hispanica TaxID=49212 RepID=UPI0020097835|nr:uncharacterized protein LOC125220464 [Salvia hispanica]